MKYNVSSVKTRFTDVYSLGFYRYQMVSEVFYRCLSSFLFFFWQDFKEGPQAQHSKHRPLNSRCGACRFLSSQVDFLEDHAFFARSDRCISGFVGLLVCCGFKEFFNGFRCEGLLA